MGLNAKELAANMLGAALPILQGGASDIETYAKSEFIKIAQAMVMIGSQYATEEINDEQARLLLRMQENASRAVLLTVRGMTLLTAEQAINAALDCVKSAVNTALGFVLIV